MTAKKSVSHLRAIGYAIAGYALWVISDAAMKLAGEATLSPYEIVGFLGFFGVLLMLSKAGARGEIKSLWPRNIRAQFIRALLALACNLSNVIALNHLPLALFFIVVFAAPMIIAVLAAIFLHEHLTLPKILAVLAGFLGIVIAVDPWHEMVGGDWIGCIAALASTTCFALSTTLLRRMTQKESIDSLVFFAAFVQMLFGFAVMIAHAEPVTLKLLAVLFVMSASGIVGNIANCAALKHTTASNVAQFHYSQIIWGALLGFLIWHDVPQPHLVAGAAIIIGSGLYIAAHARKAENLATLGPS